MVTYWLTYWGVSRVVLRRFGDHFCQYVAQICRPECSVYTLQSDVGEGGPQVLSADHGLWHFKLPPQPLHGFILTLLTLRAFKRTGDMLGGLLDTRVPNVPWRGRAGSGSVPYLGASIGILSTKRSEEMAFGSWECGSVGQWSKTLWSVEYRHFVRPERRRFPWVDEKPADYNS